MKLSRRGLFKAAAALPFVAVFGKPDTVKVAGTLTNTTGLIDYNYGSNYSDTEAVFHRDALVLIRGGRVLKPDRFGTLHGSARIGYD